MRIENYISNLLYRYQCVIIPGLGAFLTHKKPAQLHTNTNAFYPPSKELSFNAQLISNDGLLAKYIADVENTPYEEVLDKIEKLVTNWKEKLHKKEKLVLENIGELWLNNDLKLQFSPSYKLNYLSTSFGLASFTSPAIKREVLKQEIEEIEEKTPLLFTPEKRAQPPYLRYAAIALLAISLGVFGIRYLNEKHTSKLQLVEQKAKEQVENTIQEATFFDAQPVVLPVIKLDVKKEVQRHKIIAGAFRIEANADKKVAQLKAKGYNAQRIGKNKYGLYQVAYASFSNPQEALAFLRKIRVTETSEAWLLSE